MSLKVNVGVILGAENRGLVGSPLREGAWLSIEDSPTPDAIHELREAPAADLSLRELCHDLIEPTATIRWLVRAAETGPGEELHDRLEAIAAAAGQIAVICTDILRPPQAAQRVRLDEIAADTVASVGTRYAGVIDIVSQPVTARVQVGDMIRILCNLLANACRAAGPAGRITITVGEADGQARLTIADSGHGLGGASPGGRAGLGLEIVGALALKYGGSVHLGVSDLGGLAVTVQVPVQGGFSR